MLASNTTAPKTVTVECRQIRKQQPLFHRFARTSDIHAFAQTPGKGVGTVILESKDNQKYQINLHAQHNQENQVSISSVDLLALLNHGSQQSQNRGACVRKSQLHSRS